MILSKISENFDYREFLREFLRDYREYFEKVKRDYKVRVKCENVPRISWFYVNFKEIFI